MIPALQAAAASAPVTVDATGPIALPYSSLFSYISPAEVVAGIFVIAGLVWIIYTVIVSYHWIRYGHRSKIGIPMLLLHVLISTALFSYAISGFIGGIYL